MSIHPSLGSAVKGKQQKSVLKRAERIKLLVKKGLWKDESSVFGLPKVKAVRIKVKKEKAAEKPAEGQATAPSAAPTADTKAKAAAPKK